MNTELIQQLGLMTYPLILTSIIVVAVILERTVFFFKVSIFNKKTYNSFQTILYENAEYKQVIRDEFIAIEINKLKFKYFKNISILKIAGFISPLLGLLGTILGIISAFKVIAAHTSHVSPNMIADGLWEAMLTTAAGLMIAIPALIFAHIFINIANKKLQNLVTQINKDSLKIEITKSDNLSVGSHD